MYLERNVTAFHVADVNTRQYLKIYESSISQVLYQSDTQLLNESNNQCMYSVCHCQSSITSVRHTATAEEIIQSIHTRQCQLVHYYISQTLSFY